MSATHGDDGRGRAALCVAGSPVIALVLIRCRLVHNCAVMLMSAPHAERSPGEGEPKRTKLDNYRILLV